MYHAEIVDQWVITESVATPSVDGRVQAWFDATGQQNVVPPINAVVVHITCTATQLIEIENDSSITVLWSEEVVNDPLS